MSEPDPQTLTEIAVRSSVKIEMSSKGLAQVKVAIYAGESDEEMQRLSTLAITTYQTTMRSLGAAATGI